MTISPSKLRSAAACPEAFVAIDAKDARMLADAIEIADSCARADIESFCAHVDDVLTGLWWNTNDTGPEEKEMVAVALRYVEARGLIEHHPQRPELVRFKPEGGQ